MNKSKIKLYKQELLTLRSQLRADVSDMADTALAATREDNGGLPRSPIHLADVSGDYQERELAVGLLQSKDDTLARIEEALERIEEGVYGRCSDCQREIPTARLKAIPYASRCVQCAAQAETT